MQNNTEIQKKIIDILRKIRSDFPELIKYIDEMPNTMANQTSDGVNNTALKEYYDSLSELVINYSNKTTNQPETVNKSYPYYPEGHDIYLQGNLLTDVDPDNLKRNKVPNEEIRIKELDFDKVSLGDDLDVPGSELDDTQENVGSEDEENNYYSLGSDGYKN
jgi:hypothetical protein